MQRRGHGEVHLRELTRGALVLLLAAGVGNEQREAPVAPARRQLCSLLPAAAQQEPLHGRVQLCPQRGGRQRRRGRGVSSVQPGGLLLLASWRLLRGVVVSQQQTADALLR